ncbi:MAG: aminodeoxychorismate lyase [Zetaproteobacteria bacterium]|nr:MAG: aminodeoxychorismate lyase [Zetaproteobacteria bacterium]
MKLFLKIILGGFVVVSTMTLFAAAGGSWWAYQKFHNQGDFDQPIEITIPQGSSISRIAENLLYAGALEDVVLSPMIFKIGGRLTDQATKLKAGEYEIPARASMKDILDLLESGKVIQRQVTIREGLTNWEIKQLLLAHDGLSKGVEFKMKAEGMYLPETYSYQKGDSAVDIMNRMNIALEKTLSDAWEMRSPDLPLKTKEEALVLASIIEKETAIGLEHRKVAGVFINRLRKGMLLQTDPTVIYALTKGKPQNEGKGPLGRRLLLKDLKVDSPYNTYLYAGLPPTPIANAGRAAIEAALNPEEHSYIYFVADGSGGHAFAKTLSGHNRNVAKWRKIRKGK